MGALLLAAGGGAYWWARRSSPHSSPVHAAETFITALYDGRNDVAQSMLVPGQQLDVPAHAEATTSFAVTSITQNGQDRNVNLVVCTTNNGRGCGAQSGNGTAAVVPTRVVGGSWYVDQSLLPPCASAPGTPPDVVCQG